MILFKAEKRLYVGHETCIKMFDFRTKEVKTIEVGINTQQVKLRA
jgi:hypothetical protein